MSPEAKERVGAIYAALEGYANMTSEERSKVMAGVFAKLAGDDIAQSAQKPGDARRARPSQPPEPPPENERPPVASQPREARSPEDISVETVRGISRTYGSRLRKLGVKTVEDLVYLFPHRYDDFSSLKRINQLVYGEEVTIVATIWETHSKRSHRGQVITQSILTDGTGMIQATWFNQSYLQKQLQPGRDIVVSGKVDEFLGRLTFSSPVWEPLQRDLIHTGRLVPIYPLTEGIKQRWLRRTMKLRW